MEHEPCTRSSCACSAVPSTCLTTTTGCRYKPQRAVGGRRQPTSNMWSCSSSSAHRWAASWPWSHPAWTTPPAGPLLMSQTHWNTSAVCLVHTFTFTDTFYSYETWIKATENLTLSTPWASLKCRPPRHSSWPRSPWIGKAYRPPVPLPCSPRHAARRRVTFSASSSARPTPTAH